MSPNEPPEDESKSTVCQINCLTGFQRDVLFALVRVTDQLATGVAIKAEIESHYSEEVNCGRFYQNLRELLDSGLIEKQPVDGRTNAYWLTNATYEALEAHHQWETDSLRGERARRPYANR